MVTDQEKGTLQDWEDLHRFHTQLVEWWTHSRGDTLFMSQNIKCW